MKITYDYPLAAAKAFSSLSSPFKFVYTSGEGTTTTPSSFTPYFGVIKGRAEAALLELHKSDPNLLPYSVRPGFVDASGNPEIHPFLPEDKTFVERLAYGLAPAVRTFFKGSVSPTAELGRVMMELAIGNGEKLEGNGIGGEGRTVSNKGLRRLAGL